MPATLLSIPTKKVVPMHRSRLSPVNSIPSCKASDDELRSNADLDDDRPKWLPELKVVTKLAGPACLSYVSYATISLLVVMVIGRNLSKTEMSATALALMFQNVFGFSICVGFLANLDALGSQAVGAGNLKRLGYVFQRNVLLLAALSVPILGIWLLTQPILLLMQQEADICRAAARFVYASIPTLYGFFGFELIKRMLQCQSHMFPVTCAAVVMTVTCVTSLVITIPGLGWGLTGGAISLALGYYSGIAYLVFWWSKWGPRWVPWDWQEARQGWWELIQLGAPGCAMVCSEWIGFEVHAILAGIQSEAILASQSILLQTITFTFATSLGFAVACSTRVGNSLGAGKPRTAAMAAKVAIASVFVLQTLQAVILFALSHRWGEVFTDDKEVIKEVGRIMPLMCGFVIWDGLQGVSSGVLRGSGRLKLGSIVNLLMYFVLALPLGAALAFGANMGLMGQWIGLLAAGVGACMIYVVSILWGDWNKLAQEAADREQKFALAEQQAEDDAALLALDTVSVSRTSDSDLELGEAGPFLSA